MLLPPVLEELQNAGVNDLDVLIIVATGTHTPPSPEVIKELVGDKIFRNYMIISNDAVNGQHVTVGKRNEVTTLRFLRSMSKLILRSFLVILNTITLLAMAEHERVFSLGFLRKTRFNEIIACFLKNIHVWVC